MKNSELPEELVSALQRYKHEEGRIEANLREVQREERVRCASEVASRQLRYEVVEKEVVQKYMGGKYSLQQLLSILEFKLEHFRAVFRGEQLPGLESCFSRVPFSCFDK